ncbi:MAG: TolC family protein [Saprospiraceae bacterium]|nr:TolC family protein [Saprospiraceae bacterium]
MHPLHSIKSLLASILILSLHSVAAQTSMSLSDCIDYAQSNHPDIKVAQLQIRDADWQIKENKATGLPQLSGGLNYQYFIQRPGIPQSALFPGGGDEKVYFNAYHSLTPSLSLNQLFFSNSYRIALKASEYYRDYVQVQMAVAKQKVRNQVIDAYLPALLLTENLAILDKNIGNVEKLLNETKAINQAGFAEQLDVDRLELSRSTLISERNNLVRQQAIVVDALKLAMGKPIAEPLTPSDNLKKLLAEYGEADFAAELNLMNRPEYVQLLKGRELNTLQTEIYRKPWMPTVAGFVQYQPGWQGGFGDDTKWFFIPAAVAGVSISVPIWDGGGTKAKRERAIIAEQTIETQKQLLENVITFEVENARKQYLNAQERMMNQIRNLDLAQRIYDTTQTKYKAGIGSSFEITQAEQSLYAAQQSLMQAQYDLLSAKTALRKALGTN